MSAARLRRVGNRGVLVDPAQVAAVYRITRPHGVIVELHSGSRLTVFNPYGVQGRSTGAATTEDVDKVWHQLTVRPS